MLLGVGLGVQWGVGDLNYTWLSSHGCCLTTHKGCLLWDESLLVMCCGCGYAILGVEGGRCSGDDLGTTSYSDDCGLSRDECGAVQHSYSGSLIVSVVASHCEAVWRVV